MRQIKRAELDRVRDLLLKKQGFVCALCGKRFTARDRPRVDHDHATGVIRGVLHNSCNGAEGKVKIQAMRGHKGVSATEYLVALGKYLAAHSTPQTSLIHPDHVTEEQKRLLRNKRAREARARKKALEGK